jgi:hypothetical protein
MTEHPITPPPELVQQWVDAYFGGTVAQTNFHLDLANRAVQWGADQELKACCEWLSVPCPSYGRELRNARRPKPQSLKEQALKALHSASFQPGTDFRQIDPVRSAVIRRALEQLDD